jgi:hypothetical protein
MPQRCFPGSSLQTALISRSMFLSFCSAGGLSTTAHQGYPYPKATSDNINVMTKVDPDLVHLGMKAPLLVPGIAETDEDPMDTKESFLNSLCKELMQMAEREFSAFTSAVKELLGPEQAQLSAVDWLDELELMDSQPGSTSRDWRAVTIAASARLANRLNAGPHDRSFAEHVD